MPNQPSKRTLLQAAAWAEKQYHQCLLASPDAEPARKYLQQRGISAESIERFRLGFCPLQRDWILRGVEGDVEPERIRRRAKLLAAVGILARPAEGGSLYDRFQGRLLFSIHDAQGRPVGVGGRLLPEVGKGDRSIVRSTLRAVPANWTCPLFPPGEVRELARNAAVYEEQAALRAGPRPGGAAENPHGAGDGGLHRRDRGPSVRFSERGGRVGHGAWASRTCES